MSVEELIQRVREREIETVVSREEFLLLAAEYDRLKKQIAADLKSMRILCGWKD